MQLSCALLMFIHFSAKTKSDLLKFKSTLQWIRIKYLQIVALFADTKLYDTYTQMGSNCHKLLYLIFLMSIEFWIQFYWLRPIMF